MNWRAETPTRVTRSLENVKETNAQHPYFLRFEADLGRLEKCASLTETFSERLADVLQRLGRKRLERVLEDVFSIRQE